MSIGGKLDAKAYALLAQMHRPTHPDAMARAVRELAAQGVTPADVGAALKLSAQAVRALLLASRERA